MQAKLLDVQSSEKLENGWVSGSAVPSWPELLWFFPRFRCCHPGFVLPLVLVASYTRQRATHAEEVCFVVSIVLCNLMH